MGIPRPKRLPHGKVKRVRAVNAVTRKPQWMPQEQWLKIIANETFADTIPQILVFPDMSTRAARKDWNFLLKVTGVKVRDDRGESQHGGVLISGSVDQLKHAIAFSIIKRWELVLSGRAGFGMGSLQRAKPNKLKVYPENGDLLKQKAALLVDGRTRKTKWKGDEAEERHSLKLARLMDTTKVEMELARI